MSSTDATPAGSETEGTSRALRVVVADDNALLREGIASLLVLSQHLEPTYMLELVGNDASGVGYLLKDRVRDVGEFVSAVERVAAGGTAFDPEVVKALVGGHRRSVLDELTDREREVLSLI